MNRQEQINAALELIADALDRGEVQEKSSVYETDWAIPASKTVIIGSNNWIYRAKPVPREWRVVLHGESIFRANDADKDVITVREVL